MAEWITATVTKRFDDESKGKGGKTVPVVDLYLLWNDAQNQEEGDKMRCWAPAKVKGVQVDGTYQFEVERVKEFWNILDSKALPPGTVAPKPQDGNDRQRGMQIGSAQHSAAMCVSVLFKEPPDEAILAAAVERLTKIFDTQATRLVAANTAPESTENSPEAPASGTTPRITSKEAFAAEALKRWPELDLATLPEILGMKWWEWVESHNGDVAWASKEALKQIQVSNVDEALTGQ